jgi:hypothetical protein
MWRSVYVFVRISIVTRQTYIGEKIFRTDVEEN